MKINPPKLRPGNRNQQNQQRNGAIISEKCVLNNIIHKLSSLKVDNEEPLNKSGKNSLGADVKSRVQQKQQKQGNEICAKRTEHNGAIQITSPKEQNKLISRGKYKKEKDKENQVYRLPDRGSSSACYYRCETNNQNQEILSSQFVPAECRDYSANQQQCQPLNFSPTVQNVIPVSYEIPEDLRDIRTPDLVPLLSKVTTSDFRVAQPYREQLLSILRHDKKKEALFRVSLESEEDLTKPDENGDTFLMRLVSQPHDMLYELLYFMIERNPRVVLGVDRMGHNAVFWASMCQPHAPVIACYIASVLLDLGVDIDDGITIEYLAALGDSHISVLCHLLSLQDASGRAVFSTLLGIQ